LLVALVAVLAFIAGYAYAKIGIPRLVDRGLRSLAVALPTAVSAAIVVLSSVLAQ
jgi:hypothetical protein